MSIQFEYEHGTDISVLRACPNPDGVDLVAVGGEHSIEVLQVGEEGCRQVATFYIGARVTALAWSPRSTSPAQAGAWFIELVAAGDDLNLRLLTKDAEDATESIFVFGGGLSGHRRTVNDLTFCGGFGEDSFRYLASVSDDKILLFWDLLPPPQDAPDHDYPTTPPPRGASPTTRAQPLAFGVAYAHALHSVASHPSTAKELVVSDAQGSVFVVDWRADADAPAAAQLIDPRAIADARTGMRTVWGGAAAWQPQEANIIGATWGARWAVWDLRRLQGGKPLLAGSGMPHGAHRFRWCPTDSSLFALSSHSPLAGATIHIHSTAHAPHAPPHRLLLRARPHRVRDFDWVGARLAAAIGRTIVIVDTHTP